MRLHPAEQRCGRVAGPVRVPVHAAHLQPGLLPRGDRGLLRLPRPRHQPRLHRRPHLVLRPASQGLMPYSPANYSRYIVRYGYSKIIRKLVDIDRNSGERKSITFFLSRKRGDLSAEEVSPEEVPRDPRAARVPHLDLNPRHAGAHRAHRVPGPGGLLRHQHAGRGVHPLPGLRQGHHPARVPAVPQPQPGGHSKLQLKMQSKDDQLNYT